MFAGFCCRAINGIGLGNQKIGIKSKQYCQNKRCKFHKVKLPVIDKKMEFVEGFQVFQKLVILNRISDKIN